MMYSMHKPTFKYIAIIHVLFLFFWGNTGALSQSQSQFQSVTVPVVPQPKQVASLNGAFDLSQPISFKAFLRDQSEKRLWFDQLNKEFKRAHNILNSEYAQTKAKIFAGTKGIDAQFDEILKTNNLLPDNQLGPEGYLLLIKPDTIVVTANTKKGVFYGIQTLRQLVRANHTNQQITALRIRDWPDLEIRGMMDDISRGPVPDKAYMRRQIEQMAEMKINMLTYYTEHVVETESHGDFAPDAGALDIREWSDLSDYARKHHIDLVGNFQSFGHFEKILKVPAYSHLGEGNSLLSPAFEESYELLEDIYSEMIPAFHSDYFHINSDETFDLGKGASKQMVDSLGKEVVYANHIKRIHKMITGMGKKVMMWGDIALQHPKILKLLPNDITLITWGYDDMEDYAPRITPFKKAGFTQLVSTGILNSFSMMPDFNVARGNISGFVAEAVKQNVWGMLNTIWDDGGSALFSRDWYGVGYAADQSWQSNPTDTTYDRRFSRAFYGSANTGLPDAIHILNELADIKSTERMNEKIFWNKAVPDSGEIILSNLSDWPQVAHIADSAQKALQSFNPLIYPEDMAYFQLTVDQYKYLAKSRQALVEAANLYRKAKSKQQEDGPETRRLLKEAYGQIQNIYRQLVDLKSRNEDLWIRENRVYALDRVVEKYDRQIADLNDLNRRLLSAIEEFDKGHQLPKAKEIRLGIKETDGWYFQGWLMIEPIPYPAGHKDDGVDHLKDMGGVGETFPQVTQEFWYNDHKYRWKRVNTPNFAVVDLDELFNNNEYVVMYAFAHIDSPDDRTVRALVGSNDGIEVFVNGTSVHRNYVERSLTIDEDEVMLPLHEGRNHLMLKITQKTGEWGFSFRLADEEMRGYKNRYDIIK